MIDTYNARQMASSAINDENLKVVNYIMETEDEVRVDEPLAAEEIRRMKDEHYKEKIKKQLGKLGHRSVIPSIFVRQAFY